MHLHHPHDLDHDCALFDEQPEFRICWNCGQEVDHHGITMATGCPECREEDHG